MSGCQRCRDGLAVFERATLFGGVVARLCPACATAWHEALSQSPVWKRAVAVSARKSHYESLGSAGKPVGESDWLALYDEREHVEHEARLLGLEFVKPLTPDP